MTGGRGKLPRTVPPVAPSTKLRQIGTVPGSDDIYVCITGNVPVREFLDWLRSLDAALVIEFPDRADPMVQRLLSGKREGSNPDYQKALFERALEERFAIESSVPVSETRTLYAARPQA